jgi:hypothetical protein
LLRLLAQKTSTKMRDHAAILTGQRGGFRPACPA